MSLAGNLDNIIANAFLNRARLTFDVNKIPESQRFYVVEKDGKAKWILPWNPHIGLAALSGWQPYSKLSKLKWMLMLALYRMGILGILGNVKKIGIELPGPFPWYLLGWSEKGQPVPVIYVGNPITSQQKLVMFLLGANAQDKKSPSMVVKIPLGPKAKDSILNEADGIAAMLELQASCMPGLLFLDRDSGISAQTYNQATPEGRALTERHLAWLYALPDLSEMSSLLEVREALANRIAALKIDREKNTIASDVLNRLDNPTRLKAVVLHGDFAPWNIKRQSDGHLVVVDWEAVKIPSLPLLDLIHHEFIWAYTSKQPLSILPVFLQNPFVRQYMSHYGITDHLATQLFLFYLLDRWCTHLENGEVELAEHFLQDVSPIFGETIS